MLTWPTDIRPISGGFSPFVRSLSGGQSLSGFEQIQTQLHDRWTATFEFPLRSQADILAMRAFITQMRGRSNTVLLPAFELRAPWATDAYGVVHNPKWARNRTLDGTIYADAANINDTLIVAELNSPVVATDTEVEINVTTGGTPLPGMMFTIGNRLHAINTVSSVGSVHTCSIWPWLRDPSAATAIINFTSPKCEMRFATDGEGAEAFSGLTARRFGIVALRFDEPPPT